MGLRLSAGLITITGVWAGDLGAITNLPVAWNPSLSGPTPSNTGGIPKLVVIRKILFRNRSGGNGNLVIGFGDRTVAGSRFQRTHPLIFMLNGIDGVLTEEDIPVSGNMRTGFMLDTTPVNGTTGAILVGTDCVGVALATPVEVLMEVEELCHG